MKNKLAENLLRFGIKNLNESEVEKLQGLAEQGSGDRSVENISISMANMLSGTDMARIQGDATIYTFPEGSGGMSGAGDVATYDDQSVLYAVGGNQYVVIGQLGKLTGDDASNWSIPNTNPQILTFVTTPYTGTDEGAGNNVRPYPFKQPLPAANPAMVIAKLAKAFKGRAGKIDKSFPKSDNGKQFIDKMVSVFKAAGLAQDVADMDAFYKSVTNYI